MSTEDGLTEDEAMAELEAQLDLAIALDDEKDRRIGTYQSGRREAIREIVEDLRWEAERYEKHPMGYGISVALLKMAERYETGTHREN